MTKTNRQAINIRLHPTTLRELENCSEKLRTNKTAIIERAVMAFVQKECPDNPPQQEEPA